eukprot:TRINITY_DN27343_c0_g1_i1.p1 TRINITY_DN27343_c0_g1~~TRINITY_DN27343_c0_g1_i1.p1  ORF type:complete len:148 (-),score=9.67 TRINITY_DN27343_c0_g1_i1:41-484(-)
MTLWQPAPASGMHETVRWSPTEVSLAREGFNAIISRRRPYVPDILQESATMSRRVMVAWPVVGSTHEAHTHDQSTRSRRPQSERRSWRGTEYPHACLKGKIEGEWPLGTSYRKPVTPVFIPSTMPSSASRCLSGSRPRNSPIPMSAR